MRPARLEYEAWITRAPQRIAELETALRGRRMLWKGLAPTPAASRSERQF